MKFKGFAAALAVSMLVAAPALADVKVQEGTSFPLKIQDRLSSKTAQEGDKFTVVLSEDVPLADGVVLKAGYRGVGEVVSAEKNGMLGKAGKLNLRISYLKVGDQRIRLRGSKGSEGKGNVGNQVLGVVLIGVFAAVIKGHSVEIAPGTPVTAFADQDVDLVTPLATPPATELD